MVVYEFGVEDLARMRFAISPMWELAMSVRALLEPSRAALHVPWVARLRGRLRGLDMSAPVALVPPEGYLPDFLTPPPSGPLADIHDELKMVRSTPPDRVRHELGILLHGRRTPPALKPLIDDPKRGLRGLTRTFERYWQLALEPHWPRVRALLEADLAHRARRLTEGGPAKLFHDLHPAVRWRRNTLQVNITYDDRVSLAGRGLLLLPSAFGWQRPGAVTDPPWQPTVIYPARGIATLWEEGESAPAGLASLLGGTRAEVLLALDAPRSTTALAARLGVTPGGVSQQLSVLRASGLVSGRREGRSVLYVRTPLADSLVAGTSPE
jgi:hypothetical protein